MAMSPDASCGDGVDYSDTPFYTLLANGKGFARDPKTGKALGTPEVITVRARVGRAGGRRGGLGAHGPGGRRWV